ncbi:MAG: amidase family protein [Nevskia sp.]|nr:amidase family protein [Nevskia sp.]
MNPISSGKSRLVFRRLVCGALLGGLLAGLAPEAAAKPGNAQRFQVEEASIEDVQHAIQSGRTTCRDVVRAYIDRARAYNGICTRLVTQDGAPVSPGPGPVRAGSPLQFPAETIAISTLLPDFGQYTGQPIEFGHMAASRSDSSVQLQYGMLAGVPHAGQINALSTLNIRGERSISCQAECDAAAGPLPAHCPAACDAFRRQPDALEQAAQMDARYGRHPDLNKMPMYCAVFSFKDVYDTSDMRSTGGADVNYAMDAPPADSTIVAELRAKGAIIYAKANLDEYNGGSGNPGGPVKPATRVYGAGSRSTWGGMVCNPYDTARETGGSSAGSAASVGANLVNCSICEETGGSCRQPAWRNGVVGLVTTKGLLPYGGAIGADPYLDRAGIQCRTVRDTALVLDAVRDPQRGYFDPRDIYTALPNSLVSKQPYASYTAAKARSGDKPLAGLRIAIVREYMVKHSANDAAMSDMINDEIKKVLRDRLGAELVESSDPDYPNDPEIPTVSYTFQQALAEILPFHLPEYLHKKEGKEDKEDKGNEGALTYAVPGYDVTRRDYMVKTAEGLAPLSDKLNLRSITSSPPTYSFSFHFADYLLRRGDARVKDWASLNANASYFTDTRAAAMKNWEDKLDIASAGITQRMKMRDAMRMVILKFMRENNVDVLVNPTITVPPALIGHASQPVVNNRPDGRFPTSADLGIPELTVPAGFNSAMYEPTYALNPAKDAYVPTANETRPTTSGSPMPVGISFWAGPGDEPVLFRVATAYETATRHRRPPPDFGPLAAAKP